MDEATLTEGERLLAAVRNAKDTHALHLAAHEWESWLRNHGADLLAEVRGLQAIALRLTKENEVMRKVVGKLVYYKPSILAKEFDADSVVLAELFAAAEAVCKE